MKYEFIYGQNILEEIEHIKQVINEEPNTIFLYNNNAFKIYEYIDLITDDNKLDDEYTYKLKICYETEKQNVTLIIDDGEPQSIKTMRQLIGALDGDSKARIIVESDNRNELAFIVQQLIYINYPLEKIDILLRKEEADADKVKRFMEKLTELLIDCDNANNRLINLRKQTAREDYSNLKQRRLDDIDKALESCKGIYDNLDKAKDVELKFAITASKKTGKSVMVNCFIGEEISPDDIQLATPNNCVYKRSEDNLYHLSFEGTSSERTFKTRKEIYDAIKEEFRGAQKNVNNKFLTLDMNIRYVTNENNFSSYTIYDTPGPDAAGTKHKEAAYKALQMCDVAVFAIDYSKYLIDSEELYLKEVKSTFKAQNKFHSLIFALNKMDLRFTDSHSTKSIVRALDFIKNRLADIDCDYSDCIVFPTSSIEYIDAMSAEKFGANELAEEIPICDITSIRNAHRDIKCLQWLNTHALNLEFYNGLKTISYEIFKEDSGMPALMNYVSYVAKSKARDEIVNNIAYKIDTQKNKLKEIFDYIQNLERLINTGEEHIQRITEIIINYKTEVEKILSPNFNDNDLNGLKSDSILKNHEGDYNKYISSKKESVKYKCEKNKIFEVLNNNIKNKIYDNYKALPEEFESRSIDDLFKDSEFRDIVSNVFKHFTEEIVGDINSEISRFSDDISSVIAYRQNKLNELSDKCKIELQKENIHLNFPSLPSFKPAVASPKFYKEAIKFSDVDFNIHEKLGSLFDETFLSSVESFFMPFLSLFGHKQTKTYKKRSIDMTSFYETYDKKLKEKIEIVFYKNEISEQIVSQIKDSIVDGALKEVTDKFNSFFIDSLNDIKASIDDFSKVIDDREKYIKDNQNFLKHKETINSIVEATAEFYNLWETIVGTKNYGIN